jgi:ABC-type amino acid transport substrate-binding protein
VSTALILVGSLLASRWYFERFVDNAYDADEAVATMHLLREPPEGAVVYDLVPDLAADSDPSLPALERIQSRGELRIGFVPDRMPFAYVNDDAELVGLDVELTHQLARDLGVTPIYIPVDTDEIARLLEEGTIDLGIGGIPVTPDGLAQVLFPEAYVDVTAAFLVRDHDRQRFQTIESIREDRSISIAVVRTRLNEYFYRTLQEAFPNAVIDWVDSVDTFLADDGDLQAYDALLTSAERGSAISLLHPSYSVVVPRPKTTRVPIAFPVARRAPDLAQFLTRWIELVRKGPTYEQAYDHWILGKGAKDDEPRWSVFRNVFGIGSSQAERLHQQP